MKKIISIVVVIFSVMLFMGCDGTGKTTSVDNRLRISNVGVTDGASIVMEKPE